MTVRLLVLALLLHHIEGVCKPWSAATLAIRRLMDRLVDRDRSGAVERAQEAARGSPAVERAKAAAARRNGRQAAPGTSRQAISGGTTTDDVAEQLRRYQHEQETT